MIIIIIFCIKGFLSYDFMCFFVESFGVQGWVFIFFLVDGENEVRSGKEELGI